MPREGPKPGTWGVARLPCLFALRASGVFLPGNAPTVNLNHKSRQATAHATVHCQVCNARRADDARADDARSDDAWSDDARADDDAWSDDDARAGHDARAGDDAWADDARADDAWPNDAGCTESWLQIWRTHDLPDFVKGLLGSYPLALEKSSTFQDGFAGLWICGTLKRVHSLAGRRNLLHNDTDVAESKTFTWTLKVE